MPLKQPGTRRGTVSIEYACLLAVIGVIIVAGAMELGGTLRGRIASVDTALAPPSPQTPTTAPEPPASGGTAATPGPGSHAVYLFEILLLAAVCIVAVWTMRKYRTALLHAGGGLSSEVLRTSIASMSKDLLAKRQLVQLAISTHWHTAASSSLLVSEIMTQNPRSIAPDCSREELQSLLKKTGLHHMLVTTDDHLVGVVSDRDLPHREGETVGELMTPAPRTVSPATTISDAISLMLSDRISCLPVVDHGKLQGVVTLADMAMGFQCTLRALDQIAVTIRNPSDSTDPQALPEPASTTADRAPLQHV